MLENLLNHCKYWMGIAGLTLSLQACDRPPASAFQHFDARVSMPADSSVRNDGQQEVPDGRMLDAELRDNYSPDGGLLPDALPVDSSISDGNDDVNVSPDGYLVIDAGYDTTLPDSAVNIFDANIDAVEDASPPDAPFQDAMLLDSYPDADNSDAPPDGAINYAPLLCPIGDYMVNEGTSLEFLVCASDPDGDPLIFGAGNLPPGANFDLSNQLFRWIPTYTQAGQYQTTFLVSDGKLFDVETINITVLDVPCEQLFYEDADEDSFGSPDNILSACEIQPGYVENDLDCDDTDSTINPNAMELCDYLDNNCNGEIDENAVEIIDDFNRPDQNGLGFNTLGNSWTEYGTLDDWDIVSNSAETFWVGDYGYNPNVHSEIGHHDLFDILMKFRFFDTSGTSGNGALLLNVNASGGDNGTGDGLAARLAVNNYSTHALVREGADLVFGSQTLTDNINYLLRFRYDGSQLQLKIWEEGTSEPTEPLISAAAQDVLSARNYMTITGDMDMGEQAGISIDYIHNEEVSFTSYADSDGDGFGNSTMAYTGCSVPPGHVSNADDCNDTNSSINPNAPEECDGADNNCDEVIDEECDYDGDTFWDFYDNCPTVPNGGIERTLIEGETGIYQVESSSYEVILTFVDSDEARFRVNGELTPKLKKDQSYTLLDTSKIIARNISYQDYAGGIHSATFRVGAQKDSDGDGVGDACDATPLLLEPEE